MNGRIILGLIIFVAFFAFPIYYNLMSKAKPFPVVTDPVKEKKDEKELKAKVHPFGAFILGKDRADEYTVFMHRTNHMQMLNDWRDRFVREEERGKFIDKWAEKYNAAKFKNGHYELTFQNTCMQCHAREKENSAKQVAKAACNDCHDYIGVSPYCWDCHFVPQDKKGFKKSKEK